MDCKLSVKSYGVSVLAACHRVFRLQKQTFFVFVFVFLPLYILSVLKNWVFFKLLIFNIFFFFKWCNSFSYSDNAGWHYLKRKKVERKL